jgi:hypothetical protein
VKEIPLNKGYVALVDDSDYEELSKRRWFVHGPSDNNYAVTTTGTGGKHVYMHRLLLPCDDPGLQPDHINGNRLDNRRSNLRLATRSQNNINRGPGRNSTTGIKGVHFCRARKRWRAAIKCNRKFHHIGYFSDPMLAAMAYDKAAREMFGEFAWTNFPKEAI